MANGLYEYSVSPNLTGKTKVLYVFLKILNYISVFICVFSFILAFLFDNIFWILFAIFLISIIGVKFILKSNFSAYDCIFIDGEIRIDRVFNNKRKRIIAFNCKNIVLIGGVSLSGYLKYLKNNEYKKISTTNKEYFNKDFYLIVEKNGVKYLISMRYNDAFLSYVIRNSSTRIVEKDYKELLVK